MNKETQRILSKVKLSEQTWLTQKELTEYINLGKGMQAKLRMKTRSSTCTLSKRFTTALPFYKIGKQILYKRVEIDTWIEDINKPTNPKL